MEVNNKNIIYCFIGAVLVFFGWLFAVAAGANFTGMADDSGSIYWSVGFFFSVLAFLAFAGATFLFAKASRKTAIRWGWILKVVGLVFLLILLLLGLILGVEVFVLHRAYFKG